MSPEDFNKKQEDILNGRIDSAERVGWFSGAAISLSFTLLGFLLSKKYFVFQLQKYSFLHQFLIIAWIFLAVSILASLLIRLISGKWVYNDASHAYLMTNNTLAEAIKRVNPALPRKLQKKANAMAKLLRILEYFVYIGGIVGIVLLVSFLIALTSIFTF